MTNLTGKAALVTGASRGIGRAIARRLAADGALVAVHYGRNHEAAAATVTSIEQAGGRAFPVHAELGVDGDVDTLITALDAGLLAHSEDAGLDILVNNAGIHDTGGSIEQATPDAFDRAFRINVRAPFFLTQRVLPRLRDGGRLINISSSSSYVAAPPEIGYAMTKGAVNVMGRTLASALGGRGITVNTVAPGVTETDMTAGLRDYPDLAASLIGMTALGRFAKPADIADTVAFLASHDGRWITGQLLDATGGMWLGPRFA